MAGSDRAASRRLSFFAALEERPYAFSLYRALRRIECLHPEKPRLGESVRAADDPVRLGQHPSLAFAPAELHSFDPGTESVRPRLRVLSFGLFGPNGPLPLHLTEWALQRLSKRDRTLCGFLDLFHHRMLSFFYRAWANAQPATQCDRPERDRFRVYIASVFGLGMPSLLGRDETPDLLKLHFAGRLACPARNAEGLEVMLREFLGVPAAIREFLGGWLEIPPAERLRLGSPRIGRLGESADLGARVWDLQHKFRIIVGPVTLAWYESLLPGGPTFGRLASLVRLYAGLELDWDVNVILKKEEIPPLRLGSGNRLGWTAWLSGATSEHDAHDPILDSAVAGGLAERNEVMTHG